MTLTEALKREASGDWLSWTDSDISELECLRETWSIGKRVRDVIVERQANGQPFDELVEMLRSVRKLCTRQLDNWQPTPNQRRQPN